MQSFWFGNERHSFDAVYTSDLRRTVETAQLFLRNHPNRENLTIEMMPEFREVFFGSLEGKDAGELWGETIQEITTQL